MSITAVSAPVMSGPLPVAGAVPSFSSAAPSSAGVVSGGGALGSGQVVSGGGGHLHHAFNIKKVLLWSVGGALLGALIPVIPGGPIGGAIAGAALALLF